MVDKTCYFNKADLSTYGDKEEAIAFAKNRNWNEVVDDIIGEVVWHK